MQESTIQRRRFVQTALTGAAIGFAGCVSGGEEVDDNWQLGTPAEGTPSNVAGQAFARTLHENDSSFELQVDSRSGGEEVMRLLGQHDLDAGAGPNIMGQAAHHSENPTEGLDFTGDRALENEVVQAIPYMDLRVFFVSMDEEIQTVGDLAGKEVNAGPPGASFMVSGILQALGILDDVEVTTSEFEDVPFSLEEGRVDATLATASLGIAPPAYVQQMEGYDLHVLEYTDDDLDNLEEMGGFTVDEVQVGAIFDNVDIDTIDAATQVFQFWLSGDVDPEQAYEFADLSFENNDGIQEFAAFLESFTGEYAVDRLLTDVPVHSGVAEYYQDNDLWDDELVAHE